MDWKVFLFRFYSNTAYLYLLVIFNQIGTTFYFVILFKQMEQITETFRFIRETVRFDQESIQESLLFN